jgi:hypothetical protein
MAKQIPILPMDDGLGYSENSLHVTIWQRRSKFLLILYLLIMPIVIFLTVPTDLLMVSLLAYLNCFIIATMMRWLISKGTLPAMLPAIFLPMLLMCFPLPILYFTITSSEAYYGTLAGNMSFFAAGEKVQLSVMVLLLGYWPIIFLSLRQERPFDTRSLPTSKVLRGIIILATMFIISFNALSKIVDLPDVIQYAADGLFNYLNGLLFIVGALIKRVSFSVKIFLAAFLGCAILFYTVGNARGSAILCVAMLIFGVLLFSEISSKTKITILLILLFVFPAYTVIGNTTREVLGSVGFQEGFWYRLSVLKDWRFVSAETNKAESTLGRLFANGGHVIIEGTPSRVPYLPFSPVAYAKEMLETLIPGAIYYHPYYRGEFHLLDYGLRISEETSVGISMIGSFWLVGGFVAVFFGGIALGLLHSLIILILKRCRAVSSAKAFIYFSILATSFIWTARIEFIVHWHDLVYRLILCFIIYQVVRPFINENQNDDAFGLDESAYPPT